MLDEDDSREERDRLDLLVKPVINDLRELVLNIAPQVAPSLPKELRGITVKNVDSVLHDAELVLNAITQSDAAPGELAKVMSSFSRLLNAHTSIGTGAGIAFAKKRISEQTFRRAACAADIKRTQSQKIDEVVSSFACPCAKRHPTWKSRRIADEIESAVNSGLAKIVKKPLKADSIRKRVSRIINRPST